MRKRILRERTLGRNSSHYMKSKSQQQYIQQNDLTRTQHTVKLIKNRESPKKLPHLRITFGDLRKHAILHVILEQKKNAVNN